jgi:hypothetical protein
MGYFGRTPGRELCDGLNVAAVFVSQFLLGDDVSPQATTCLGRQDA